MFLPCKSPMKLGQRGRKVVLSLSHYEQLKLVKRGKGRGERPAMLYRQPPDRQLSRKEREKRKEKLTTRADHLSRQKEGAREKKGRFTQKIEGGGKKGREVEDFSFSQEKKKGAERGKAHHRPVYRLHNGHQFEVVKKRGTKKATR